MYNTKTKGQQQRSATAAAAKREREARSVRSLRPQGQGAEGEVQKAICAASERVKADLVKQAGKGSLGYLLNLKRGA